jgi:Dockerin type I domain
MLLSSRSKRTFNRRRLSLTQLESRLAPAIFTVTNTNDDGTGSLRQAILDANATLNVGGVPDEIHFNIPDGGVQTIAPLTDFPDINETVIINGYTQPGASPNNLNVGDNAALRVVIDGGSHSLGRLFYFVGGDKSSVRGLVLDPASIGIEFIGNQITVAGNFIGTDATGSTFAVADGTTAIQLNAGTGNVIGGTAPADRNVIVGGGSGGRVINLGVGGAGGTVLQGNYIGVNAAGTTALHAFTGSNSTIRAGTSSSGGNVIGGSVPGAGNVIVGFDTSVIDLASPNNLVQGNYIGTNATGTAGLGGQTGIFLNDENGASNNAITGNLISGMATGIFALISNSTGTVIRGNKIGTDATGTTAIPNSNHGIQVSSSNVGNPSVAIGGTSAADANVIAFNGGVGVFVAGGPGSASILGNSIFANGGLGIDLSDGNVQDPVTHVNPNDLGDGDTGVNSLQNYPVITSASIGGATTAIGGTLNSTPTTSFRIEFFANNSIDPSGFGEGKRFLGAKTVATDSAGNVTINATNLGATASGEVVTATATNVASNETSEFSKVFPFSTNPPARVGSVVINGGAAQRSRVLTVQVNFDQIVTLPTSPANAFTLARNSDNAPVTLAAAVDNSGPGTVVTLTFIGGAVNSGSLADGRYTLTVLASQVSSVNGQLDGDGNGSGGDDFVLVGTPGNKLFRLFGDVNGDGAVAASDFVGFRQSFNGINDDFDFDGDGSVSTSDFVQFRNRFNTSI